MGKQRLTIYVLVVITAVLTGAAASVGLFWGEANTPYTVETLRGQTVSIYNSGPYTYDTVFIGAGFRGQDTIVLFLTLPLLVISLIWSLRGSLNGHLSLLGLAGYFVYAYASMSLSAAYNPLFLVYVGAFSASLYLLILIVVSIDRQALSEALFEQQSYRGMAVFFLISGIVTLFVWGFPLVEALLTDTPPLYLDTYTTMVTYALDLAIITPATFITAVLLLRRHATGYLITMPLLTLIILLAPQIALSTYYQQAAGVPFTVAEIVGPIGGFVVLGLAAFVLVVRLFRSVARPVAVYT